MDVLNKNVPQFVRCKVTDTSTHKVPENTNATLVGGNSGCGYVLLDNQEQVTAFAWGWIYFEKGVFLK